MKCIGAGKSEKGFWERGREIRMDAEGVLETLVSRGWSFRNPDEIKSLILTKISSSSSLVPVVESELLNLDLRSIGEKSLPDPSSLKKSSSHINGPKVLQLVSTRDIYQSSIDAPLRKSQHNRRLLRFVLTDGHSEVTALEYVPIPSISEEIIPGTKVRLENKISVHNGILCLNPKVVVVVGGIVPSLYEEWQMSQKYSGFSRSALRVSQSDNGSGPPPFERLQIGAHASQIAQSQGSPDLRESTLKYSSNTSSGRQVGMNHDHQLGNKGLQVNANVDKAVHDPKNVSSAETSEGQPCSSEARPKEVSEAVPVQNQAAAQKLLQKLSQPTGGDRYTRGHRHRLKGKQEEEQVFTLDEWEKRKGSGASTLAKQTHDVSRDEELARQLQNQLDLEDFHGKPDYAEAEQIRMSMFNFGGAEERRDYGRGEPRGRGRGRGRRGRRFG